VLVILFVNYKRDAVFIGLACLILHLVRAERVNSSRNQTLARKCQNPSVYLRLRCYIMKSFYKFVDYLRYSNTITSLLAPACFHAYL
jgi:hypothetical protein